MAGVGEVLVVISVVAVGGCELVLDLDSEDEVPASMPDGGSAVVDAGETVRRCETNPLYERMGSGNSTYRILSPDPFQIARSRCQGDDAELTVIGTSAEQADLEFDLTDVPSNEGCLTSFTGCLWIGLTQPDLVGVAPEDGWEWVDGRIASIVWEQTQPDDGDGNENGEENCAVLDSGGLQDRPCDAEHHAICECVLGPDP